MQIYVHHSGQQLGPFTEAEVRAKLANGSIVTGDLVWWQGQANWLPLAQTFLVLPAMPTALPAGAISLPPPPPVPTPGPLPTSRLPHGVETSTLAIGALVLGILGFFCGYTGIGAVILGHLSLGEIKRYPALKGREMAVVGMVLGYVAITLFVLGLLHLTRFSIWHLIFPALHFRTY